MTVENLVECYCGKVVIYSDEIERGQDCFVDLYKGEVKKIPFEILNKTVRIFGAKRKGVLDICV